MYPLLPSLLNGCPDLSILLLVYSWNLLCTHFPTSPTNIYSPSSDLLISFSHITSSNVELQDFCNLLPRIFTDSFRLSSIFKYAHLKKLYSKYSSLTSLKVSTFLSFPLLHYQLTNSNYLQSAQLFCLKYSQIFKDYMTRILFYCVLFVHMYLAGAFNFHVFIVIYCVH